MRDWVITGSREGHPRLTDALSYWERVRPPLSVHVGDATGVDAQAKAWAEARKIPCYVHKADWDGLGKSAGPRRNQTMVHAVKPGATCFAFPDSQSVGTWDCIRRASAAGLLVCIMAPPEVGT